MAVLHNQYALILMFLLWHNIFPFSFASTSNSNISIVTLNLANYDDHHHWKKRLQLIVRSLLAADADLIALQETRMNPDHPSSKRTYQNMASQVLSELNKQGAYIGAQLVTQPTMYYPTYISGYESTFSTVLEMYHEKTLPSPWKEEVSSMIKRGNLEGVRNYIRKQYALKGMLTGGYVNPIANAINFDPDYENNKTILWEGSSIISKRRILETGTLFMTSPHNCKDINQRATQYISVDLDSFDSYLSPGENNRINHPNRFYLFNAHLGLEPACLISEVQDTTEYMNRMSGPSLLVGDFNAEPWHPAWDYFRKAGLTDLWQHLHPEHNDSISEHQDNLATTGNSIFDYVGEEMRDALKGNDRFDLEDAISDLEYAYGEEERIKECQFDGWCTFPSDKPYKRIDYAWANKKLTPFISSIDIIGNKSQITKRKKKKLHIYPSDHYGYIIKFNFTSKHNVKD